MPRAPKDMLAGVVFVALGLGFAVISATYDLGTSERMGPGSVPFVLGGILTLLGGVVFVRGLTDGEEGPVGAVPWRGVALILGAVVFFGLTVRGLGVVPATFVSALMSAFASRRTGVITALLIGLGLTIICVLIFIVALRLRLPLVGPWIPV